jgi:hypothetical protein
MLALALWAADLLSDAGSERWVPAPGVVYVYKLSDGRTEETRLARRVMCDGRPCYVLDTWEFFSPNRVQPFISVSPDGVRLHKVDTRDDTSVVLSPPTTYVKGPLRRGAEWREETELRYKDAIGTFKAKIHGRVLGYEEVKVAAGRFRCIGIEFTWIIDSSGVKQTDTLWYAPGAGLVKQTSELDIGGSHQSYAAELTQIKNPAK